MKKLALILLNIPIILETMGGNLPFPENISMLKDLKKVLIVDDEETLTWSMAKSLSKDKDKYEVFIANNGKDALSLLQNNKIDLVISDIRMPDINGLDLLVRIKKEYPETKVIIMTAYGSSDVQKEANRRGSLYYVEKPFEISDIRKIIIDLKKFNININIKIMKQVFTIILILIIVLPSYNYFKKSVYIYLIPWINKDTYDRIIKTNELIEENKLENPVLVFHGSPGKAALLSSYVGIALGEHYGYYGKLEDALELTPPDNLTYLSLHEYDVAKTYYYGEFFGERGPLSELRSDEITIIIITSFYDLPIPSSYKSENGITIIKRST